MTNDPWAESNTLKAIAKNILFLVASLQLDECTDEDKKQILDDLDFESKKLFAKIMENDNDE